MPPAIEQRIAEEQAKIDVPSYQDAAWDGAWKRRAGALWGMSTVGGVTGAIIGAAALIPPALMGAVPLTLAAVATSTLIFAALGISTGFAIGAVVGGQAGAAASTAKELERRLIARDVENKLRENPAAHVCLTAKPAASEREPTKWMDYVNVKTGLLFAAIGAVGGLIFAGALSVAPSMASNFAMPAMELLLGKGATTAAIAAYSAGLGACFGSMFGVSYTKITRDAVNFAGKLLSGEALSDPWPISVNLPDPKPILNAQVDVEPTRSFAENTPAPSNYRDLIATQQQGCEPCQVR